MTAQTLTLSIAMSSATVGALQQSGFVLYAFRPVTSSNKSGVPLVWACLANYLETVNLAFDAGALFAYISTGQIAVDNPVTIGASATVSGGQMVSVAAGGTLSVTGGAPSGDVYIANTASANYTCGLGAALAQMPQQPFCAFNLYPQVAVTMQPAPAIFVMWATSLYDPGVYMKQSLGPGLFVAFNGEAQRAVSYDMTLGWQANGAVWAQQVGMGADLSAALILDPGHNHPVRR